MMSNLLEVSRGETSNLNCVEFASGTYQHLGNTKSMGLTGSSFTVTCWIKYSREDYRSPRDFCIVGQDTEVRSQNLHILIRNERPHFGFYYDDTSGTTVLSAKKWYHLAFVYNMSETSQTIFVNGKIDAHSDHHRPLSGDAPLYVSRFRRAMCSEGKIANLRIWRAALPIEIIRQNSFCNVPSPIDYLEVRLNSHVQQEDVQAFSRLFKSGRRPAVVKDSTFPPDLHIQRLNAMEMTIKSNLGMTDPAGEDTVIVLLTVGQDAQVHEIEVEKRLLEARSEYFRAMFSSSMIESHSTTIRLEEVDPAVLRQFVRVINTLEVQDVTIDMVMIAQRFQALDILCLMEVELSRQLNVGNIFTMLLLCSELNLSILQEFCDNFLKLREKFCGVAFPDRFVCPMTDTTDKTVMGSMTDTTDKTVMGSMTDTTDKTVMGSMTDTTDEAGASTDTMGPMTDTTDEAGASTDTMGPMTDTTDEAGASTDTMGCYKYPPSNTMNEKCSTSTHRRKIIDASGGGLDGGGEVKGVLLSSQEGESTAQLQHDFMTSFGEDFDFDYFLEEIENEEIVLTSSCRAVWVDTPEKVRSTVAYLQNFSLLAIAVEGTAMGRSGSISLLQVAPAASLSEHFSSVSKTTTPLSTFPEETTPSYSVSTPEETTPSYSVSTPNTHTMGIHTFTKSICKPKKKSLRGFRSVSSVQDSVYVKAVNTVQPTAAKVTLPVCNGQGLPPQVFVFDILKLQQQAFDLGPDNGEGSCDDQEQQLSCSGSVCSVPGKDAAGLSVKEAAITVTPATAAASAAADLKVIAASVASVASATSLGCGLRRLFEDSAIKKIVFDGRQIFDALSHLFGISPEGVLDCQMAIMANSTSTSLISRVRSLGYCTIGDAAVSRLEPMLSRSYAEDWTERPLSPAAMQAVMMKAAVLPRMLTDCVKTVAQMKQRDKKTYKLRNCSKDQLRENFHALCLNLVQSLGRASAQRIKKFISLMPSEILRLSDRMHALDFNVGGVFDAGQTLESIDFLSPADLSICDWHDDFTGNYF